LPERHAIALKAQSFHKRLIERLLNPTAFDPQRKAIGFLPPTFFAGHIQQTPNGLRSHLQERPLTRRQPHPVPCRDAFVFKYTPRFREQYAQRRRQHQLRNLTAGGVNHRLGAEIVVPHYMQQDLGVGGIAVVSMAKPIARHDMHFHGPDPDRSLTEPQLGI
jgi:hypothetical protein